MREKSPSESLHLWSDYRVGVGGGYGGGSTGIKPSLLSSSIPLKTGRIQKNNQRRKVICRLRLVAEGLEGLRRLLVDLGVLLRVGELALSDLLALVVGSALGLAALLESGNDVLVLPADLVGETANGAELTAGLQSQDTEGLGDDHLLLLVVGRGNTLEDLETLKSGGTASSLVGDHATDGLVEDTRRGAEVEGTTASRVVTGHLAQVGVVLELGTEELARDVEGLGADNDDLLAVEKLLGDDGGKTTKEMALAVDDDLERGTGVSDLYLQNVFAVDR